MTIVVDVAGRQTLAKLAQDTGMELADLEAVDCLMGCRDQSEPWFDREAAAKVSDAQIERCVTFGLVRRSKAGKLQITKAGAFIYRRIRSIALGDMMASSVASLRRLGATGVQIGSKVYVDTKGE